MKKAKEYYKEIKIDFQTLDESIIEQRIIKTFRSYMDEIKELIETRNAKSNSALISIIKELNNKWNSMCDKLDVDDLGFMKHNGIEQWAKDNGYV